MLLFLDKSGSKTEEFWLSLDGCSTDEYSVATCLLMRLTPTSASFRSMLSGESLLLMDSIFLVLRYSVTIKSS